MPELKALQEELEQVYQRRDDLRSKNSGATMTAEATQQDEAFAERASKLVIAIEQEKLKERDRKFGEVQSYMNDPLRLPLHPVNDDDAGRKTLQQAGWKTLNGVLIRPTSLGLDIPMYQEEVIFGPMPERAGEAEFYKQTRAAFQPEYRTAYIKFIKLVAKMGDVSVARSEMTTSENKALSEGVDTAGGYLVPPDIQAEIFARVAQTAVMRSICRIVNTSRDRVLWPRVEPAASTASGVASGGGSIFSSAFIGTWFGESATQTDIDPVFGTLEISIRKIRAATKMSNDFISDAITDIPAFLATDGGRNIALVEDQGLLLGGSLGHPSLEPMGLLNDAALQTGGASAVDVEGSTANTLNNTTSNAGSAPKLIDVSYGLPAQYAGGASWLFRRAIEGKIRKLVDGSGRYLWPPMIASGFAQVVRELLGNPVYNSDFVPNDGTDTNQVVVFGDFSAYIIAQRAQITTTVLRERYADTDQTGIILWERLGGGLSNPDAFRVGVV